LSSACMAWSSKAGEAKMRRSAGCSGTTDLGCTRPCAISAHSSSSKHSPSQPDQPQPGQTSKSSTPMNGAF
jgi:hypothetical protein